MGKLSGLSNWQFITYCTPLATIFLACWVILSFYGLKKQKPTSYWLILVISAVGVTYLAYLPFYNLPYMYGDSFYHFSFVKSIVDGNFLNDVCYDGYPTYYPPLYYLLSGFLMWLFKASWVTFFIYMPIFNILLICFSAYFVARYIKDETSGVLFILIFFTISSFGTSYLTRGTRISAGLHSAIVIPHEVLAVILLILGVFIFSREKKQDQWWAGLIGGIVTLLSVNFAVYYALSLLVYAIIRAFKTRNCKLHIIRLIVTGFITFLVSSVYLVPYIWSIINNGADDFHWKWTILSNFDPYLVTIGLGFMGLTFILGVLGIISLPKSNFKLVLIITLVILYVGRFHVYVTKPLFNMSYVPDHAYYALVFFLSFTGAIFLRDFPVKITFKKWTLERLKIGHIFLASTFFLPIIIWNPVSNSLLYNSFKPIPKKIEHITSIINNKTGKDDIVLASREISPWILLMTGRHLAISSDPWTSNPSARYSLRHKDFSEAFTSGNIKVIKNNLNKWKVNIIVFVKKDNKWGFNASGPYYGRFRQYGFLTAEIDKNIFNNDFYFTKLYQDADYVVLYNN